MKSIIKYFIIIVPVMAIVILLTGCMAQNTEHAVKQYLDKMEIFSGENSYKLSDASFKVKSHTLTDYVWKVSANIDGENIVFFVVDAYYDDPVFGTKHTLMDSYQVHLIEHTLSDIDLHSFELTYDYATYPEGSNLNIDKDIIRELNCMHNRKLKSTYNDYAEGLKRFDEISDVFGKLPEATWESMSLGFSFKYTGECQQRVKGLELNEADVSYTMDALTQSEEITARFRDNYILMHLQYRFCNISETFSYEEISEAVANSRSGIMLSDDTEFGADSVTDCLICVDGGISFGTLYELLKRSGQNVVGSTMHFTYYKDDENVYEFSYSFNDYLYTDGEYGYYYKLNGTTVSLTKSFHTSLRFETVHEITGLSVVTVNHTEEKGFHM